MEMMAARGFNWTRKQTERFETYAAITDLAIDILQCIAAGVHLCNVLLQYPIFDPASIPETRTLRFRLKALGECHSTPGVFTNKRTTTPHQIGVEGKLKKKRCTLLGSSDSLVLFYINSVHQQG